MKISQTAPIKLAIFEAKTGAKISDLETFKKSDALNLVRDHQLKMQSRNIPACTYVIKDLMGRFAPVIIKPAPARDQVQDLTASLIGTVTEGMQENLPRFLKAIPHLLRDWDENINPMILPKILLIALLETQADQYRGRGTSFEDTIKTEVNNLKLIA